MGPIQQGGGGAPWYFGNPGTAQPQSSTFPDTRIQPQSSFPDMRNQNPANMFQQRGLTPQGPSTIPGRMVESERDILPNEIPMDGSIALFLQSDLQCIYAKAWNNRGTIDSVRYILEPQQETAQPSVTDQFQQDLMARLNKIEEMLEGLSQPRNSNAKNTKQSALTTTGKEGEAK